MSSASGELFLVFIRVGYRPQCGPSVLCFCKLGPIERFAVGWSSLMGPTAGQRTWREKK